MPPGEPCAMAAHDVAYYRHHGHLTVNHVFEPGEMDAVVRDIEQWGESFLAGLPEEQRAWYVDGGVQARTVLRKLDNPKRKKKQHVAPTTTVLENELLKSDQQLRDAIRAYDAAQN